MPDPGFVAGVIGWAIGRLINEIIGYINRAVHCKQELETLRDLLDDLQRINSDLHNGLHRINSILQMYRPDENLTYTSAAVDGWLEKLKTLLKEAATMVEKCTKRHLISLHLHSMSKKIARMITKIREHQGNSAFICSVIVTQLALIGISNQLTQSSGQGHNTVMIASSTSAPPPTASSVYIMEPLVQQVIASLRNHGLESSNLILGIDFSKSNESIGKHSYNRRSLHAIGNIPNIYEEAIFIIEQTLSPFDEDNLIPCFGFGNATTPEHGVFSFFPDRRPCKGFKATVAQYREIVPRVKPAETTSFAPIIQAAMEIVERERRQYHILVIIAGAQVTSSSDTSTGRFSLQEQKTIDAIVAASHFPLSIVLVGVGDGPWEAMQKFYDDIPSRVFDNFQFVDLKGIMSKNMTGPAKVEEFALVALMKISVQYKKIKELGLLG